MDVDEAGNSSLAAAQEYTNRLNYLFIWSTFNARDVGLPARCLRLYMECRLHDASDGDLAVLHGVLQQVISADDIEVGR